MYIYDEAPVLFAALVRFVVLQDPGSDFVIMPAMISIVALALASLSAAAAQSMNYTSPVVYPSRKLNEVFGLPLSFSPRCLLSNRALYMC